jgi:hypothetical protein
MDIKRYIKQLKLGKNYVIWYDKNNYLICKFIQPTKCGFNFLNLKTHKCVLKHHLYPSKYEKHISGDYFFINPNLKIIDYKK